MLRPVPSRIRRDSDLYALEAALHRRGLGPVAGADEAGRGACAGPLVVAAVRLPPNARFEELNDSKLLTEAARERVFELLRRSQADISVVAYGPDEIDRRGIAVCNLEGMRVAVARLPERPGYVLTDGFPVPGLPGSLGVVKGDRTAACVAAAGVVAKVTRDRIMTELDRDHPEYGFAVHKGYSTPMHEAALERFGPCEMHRKSYANVAARAVPAARI
ncbi:MULTISPECIES: ribonuclease HII [Glycomyces]|jgi:ribonuclease HII|uniref:Ribonuclease HII n=2 Tax=Glycomyces TaxID=58113 RepID=A0A9X3PI86_9ACTN|nr:ribonuclease HII [Glycomyces lechevalierae]MDA1385795.1 ribonuclease HII [Glycomyces lechevalierae]MDR7339915.1 ribonuclease HII [Glycomyces lechevalierae]